MAPARKRQRREESPNEEDAYCPFRTVQATAWSTNTKSKKKQKRRKVDSDSVEPDEGEDGEGNRQLLQLSPFTPSMGLEGYPTLDMHYAIEPYKEWVEMTRYNSFVLNSTKYFCEGFVYVANENTVQRERNEAGAEGGGPKLRIKKKSDDDWVARILEIRAKDEHHVYARVYWMYWPDELIEGTMYRGKPIKGRQPFHGTNELIASNHSASTRQLPPLCVRV